MRKRGVSELSEEDLERGAVSEAYVKAQLHRSFPKTNLFQRLLKTVWHQVATAGEVFVVGEILEDDTVKGGTGWAPSLPAHFHKRLHVYDQTKGIWFRWTGDSWRTSKLRRFRARASRAPEPASCPNPGRKRFASFSKILSVRPRAELNPG